MKNAVWGLVLLLVILHQDFWYWDDPRLVFGFLPISLLYHALLSIAAGLAWWLATKYAWPDLDGGDASSGSDGDDAA